MAVAIPDNVVADFRNAGLSRIIDNDRVIRSNLTPHSACGLLEFIIQKELLGLAEEEVENRMSRNIS
jgi:hypothetical protein